MNCAPYSSYTATITTNNGIKTIPRNLVSACFETEVTVGNLARGCFYFTRAAATLRQGSLKIHGAAQPCHRTLSKKTACRNLVTVRFRSKTYVDNLATQPFKKTDRTATLRKGHFKKTGLPQPCGEGFLKNMACRNIAEGILTQKTAKTTVRSLLTTVQ